MDLNEVATNDRRELVPGEIVDGMPHEVYHRRELGVVSTGALKLIRRTPAHYKAWVDGQDDSSDSPALAMGKAFHCALLEPDRFDLEYVVQPDFGDCRFKENKTRRNEWLSENAGRISIDEGTDATIRAMAKSVRKHRIAGRMIRDGVPELTVKWTDQETGLKCKLRSDYYVERRAMIVDIKTSEDASPDAFARSILRYDYHIQDAHYRAGFRSVGKPADFFVFVVVEKRPPFATAVYQLDSASVEKGHTATRKAMDLMAECLRTNKWPAYSDSIQDITLPPWAA